MANGGWKIARNRGGAQLPIALLAALAVALILVGKAQSNLFDRARANVTDFAAPALQAVRAPLGGLDRWMASIGEIFSGPGQKTQSVPALAAGSWFFRCDVHPDMQGTIVAE